MQTKTRKKYSENFLNNQNYILGKTEKKKVLSKFFVDLNFKNIYIFFSKLHKIIKGLDNSKKNFPSFFIFYFIISFIILIILKVLEINTYIINLQNIIIFFIINIFLGIFVVNKVKMKESDEQINDISSYFLTKNKRSISMLIFLIIFPFFYFLMFLFFSIIGKLLLFFLLFFFVFISAFINTNIFRIKLFNVFLFPFIFLYHLFSIILLFIYVFIIRGIKGYNFIKQNPNGNLLTKFDKIDKGSAENGYYEILEI